MINVIEQIANQELRAKHGNRYFVVGEPTDDSQSRSEGDLFTIALGRKFEYRPASFEPARIYEWREGQPSWIFQNLARRIITGTIDDITLNDSTKYRHDNRYTVNFVTLAGDRIEVPQRAILDSRRVDPRTVESRRQFPHEVIWSFSSPLPYQR